MAFFDDGRRVQNRNLENGLMNEVGLQYQNYDRNERERDMNMYRSGSAPPTIEGSYNAISSLFGSLDGGLPEEEMRSHPAYLSYYYSHDNINPRLPPPLLSKEEWRMHQRMRSSGLPPFGETPDWRKRGLIDDGNMDHSVMNLGNTPCQASSLWIDNKDHEFVRHGGSGLGVRRKSFADIFQEGSNALPSTIPRHATRNASYNFLDSSNSNFRQDELWNGLEVEESLHSAPNFGRVHTRHSSPSSSFSTAVGSYVTNGKSSSMNNLSDFAAYLSLSGLDHTRKELVDNTRLVKSQIQLGHTSQLNFQSNHPSSRTPVNLPSKANSTRTRGLNEQHSYNNTRTPVVTNHASGGYSMKPNSNKGVDSRLQCGINMQLDHHNQPTDLVDAGQYYRHLANSNLLLQKQRFGLPLLQKGHGINDGYYEGLAYLLGMPYQGASMGNSLSEISNNMKGMLGMTLLEEFKNKTRSFELSDIVGHVVEFSMDQCGSRFIQQKLETATNEEKMKVFPEIAPHARALMTDVFGNYVIQKFFERGMESQKNALVGQIRSHVLQLSLQMYGCRVIQKALETVNVDLKIQMVTELDGSVLKCVRDQNGNHVIQKCIECVPEDKIQFIISSFFGQIVPLSTHPYGCRVIQRVLEHSKREETQKHIMVEILHSICNLAQDQYGNYVIQHVIQHGKPEERSIIIKRLACQVVQMSQQKYASNVIEKCLTFGCPKERQVLVNEMLGSTDVNEPLQDMMKDPFGNYVVQKVLETCDQQTRELILSRVKLHLCDLKKYTYVKHVVARVEKLLITAGERSPEF